MKAVILYFGGDYILADYDNYSVALARGKTRDEVIEYAARHHIRVIEQM